MTIWVDAQLPPAIAAWIAESHGVEAVAVRDLGLRDAMDQDIFAAAQAHEAIVLTKDRDLVHLVERHGPPPHVLWLTCGNTSNARLHEILRVALGDALALVAAGERLVEISGA